jgi:hypothetical protein
MSSIEYDFTSDDDSDPSAGDVSAAGFSGASFPDGASGGRVVGSEALEEGAEGAGEESGEESGEEPGEGSGEGVAGEEDDSSGDDTESGSGEERSFGAPVGFSGRAC